jgi:NAD(P)-dependent dehydrogenase (short-subunit alcohol dehydrogenase family)
VINTNLLGLVRVLNPLVKQMESQPAGGEIAIIASLVGYFGLPRAAAYNASKAALISLAQTMRTELAPRNIAVRVVNPGFYKSELTARNDFPMPLLLETDAAADRMLAGLFGSKRFEVAFPRRITFVMKLIRLLPYPLFFALTRLMMPKDPAQK